MPVESSDDPEAAVAAVCARAPELKANFTTKLEAEWEPQVRYALVSTSAIGTLLLISAPGAGKTYLLNELRKECEGVQIIDASSETLMDVSLESWLNDEVRESVGVLVVDEYHWLDDEPKRELFQWVARRQREQELKIVMIGNRYKAYDGKLVASCTAPDGLKTQLLRCRLSVAKAVTGLTTPPITSHLQGLFLTAFFTGRTSSWPSKRPRAE